MPEDDIEGEYFTAISLDYLLLYGNKHYLQVYLDNCDYKICKQRNDRLSWWKYVWRLDVINTVYNQTDISKGIDLVTSNSSKECMVCHHWCFNHGFKFQDYTCNDCNDLTMWSVNISNVAIIAVKNVDYCCIIHNISKSEAINLLKNYVLENYGYIYKKYYLSFSSF